MGMRSLVICPDAETLALLVEELQKVEVAPIACGTQLDALDLLWQEHFDAVIVDCDSLPHGLDLVKLVRVASGRTAVILSLVTGEDGMKKAFGACGLRFLHIPLDGRRAFEKWLSTELQKSASGATEMSR